MSQMQPDLEGYFRNFVPRRDPLLLELERQAGAEGIPIVGPVVGELLAILARISGAVNILELGTATGYSALHLARGSEAAGGRIVTLEWAEGMAGRARANFAKAGLSDRIEVRVGDALKLMDAMAGPVDFIFMDLDKEFYLPALPHCRRLLKIGGLLFTDNVGFAGAADFNREIFASEDWRTVHLLGFLPSHSPEHDGLSLAVRIK
jgi:predicted O-methyltransferase YrrM